MNKENILKVADAIEQHSIPDLGFNMGWWHFVGGMEEYDLSGHHCGTVACIGGWTEAVIPDEENAQQALAITGRQVALLFYPESHWEATPAQAVAVLRHLAETGEVDWSIADTVSA